MKTVLTYGTFDLFHHGHVRLLRRLRDLGDRLIVGCSTDEFNLVKNKKCVIPFEQRREVLESCRFVDLVIPEVSWDQKVDDIKDYIVSIFAMGDDWSGKFDFLSDHVDVIYLPRTENVSTTDIKQYLSSIHQDRIGTIRNILSHLNDEIARL